MPDLGQFALRLGLFLSSYALLVDLVGRLRHRRELLVSGRNATLAALLCLTVACGVLGILLVRSDFAVQYVAENTARALPLVYKLTALWAGAAGSLLLWLWLQTGFVVGAFSRVDEDTGRFCAAARAAANLVAVFFFLVLIFDKDPFRLSVTTPRDGAGLNPLLQHPAMVLHPPALFLGYAAFVIPYAWTFAALGVQGPGRPGVLLDRTRQWLLFAWMFLSIGIALGAWWAYEELGWGGYWAWDPVENSSLIPWLTATALLHCARTYRTGGKTSHWFMVLAIATFSLCIFGTFLTRYGLVSSVHAFPDPGLGILFLVLLILIWVAAGLLVVARWLGRVRSLRMIAARPEDGAVAERTRNTPHGQGLRFIVWNNWLMVLLAFVILAGTLFPFFSGLFSAHPITLKSEYFTKITAPGGLALLLLLGICPHLVRQGLGRGWRTVGAVITAAASLLTWTLAGSLAIACLVACAFVGVNLGADFVQRYAGRREGRTLRASLRWHGARVVHLGVVLAFVGIAGSSGFDVEKQVALRPGEQVQVGGLELTYHNLDAQHGPNFTAVVAEVSVRQGQRQLGKLTPSVAFYAQSDKRTSEVDIRRSLAGDLYLALTEADNSSRLINLTIFLKPLINWIWIGTILMVLGTALVFAAGLGRGRVTGALDTGGEP
ncbi:MAG: cytochrome c biogenesis protein CcsA [Planctomycetes bacterium]|jgi:cytochrome c-type biogenesis protein CcmF|nr:cytochrome c biogenesis protein CcsA [Planctomycetota bacterium]